MKPQIRRKPKGELPRPAALPPTERFIAAACGHQVRLKVKPGDMTYESRLAKLAGQDCGPCRARAHDESQRLAAAEARARKKQDWHEQAMAAVAALPDGTYVVLEKLGADVWEGVLTTPGGYELTTRRRPPQGTCLTLAERWAESQAPSPDQ